VDILFASKQWERLCHDQAVAVRALGAQGARKLQSRLDDLYAAADLSYAAFLPGRFRALDGNHAGCYSIQLIDGYQLVISPVVDRARKLSGGKLDLSSVMSIRIVFVGKSHD
jgi:toxin HigB-1